MAKQKLIYRITLTNFSKYNSSIKKGHKATLISNKFCEDAKLRMLPMTTRWLFLNLILTCGDFGGDTVELSSDRLREMLECNRNIDRALSELEEIQVLTFEKNEFLLNRIERKGIEKNRIENKRSIPEPVESTDPKTPPQEKIPDQLFECKFFKRLTDDTKTKILNAYPRDFLEREIASASSYLEANHWRYANREDTFLTSHLSRQWNYLKSKGLQPISESDRMAEIARDLGVKL